MFNFFKKVKKSENQLYNKILYLSRNKFFYTKVNLCDNFQNRINLIFLHISFLFVKTKQKNINKSYKDFQQKNFDYIFKEIESNMREIGYGDVTVNKNMKFLVKNFYNILLNCENYNKKTQKHKNTFLHKYLTINDKKVGHNDLILVDYFDKYQKFCLDLSYDSVLKGELNFNYK
jgi:cytochrome b pre-mRNA-processing protein 3